MTVTVETPEGIKTGSAVREASRYTEPSILPDQGGTFYNITKGEAVVVDLGHRGVLFGLIGRQAEAKSIFRAKIGEKNEVITLSYDQYPMLVYFKDPLDPKTVVELSVDNRITKGRYGTDVTHFTNAFGDGVFLKSITLEQYTNDVANIGITRYLPWLIEIKDYIDGKFAGGGPELSNILDKGDFIKG